MHSSRIESRGPIHLWRHRPAVAQNRQPLVIPFPRLIAPRPIFLRRFPWAIIFTLTMPNPPTEFRAGSFDAQWENGIGFESDYLKLRVLSDENPFRGSASRNVHLSLDKPANIYWAASDVMETIMRLLNTTVSAALVFSALKQFRHHVEQIGADKIPDVGPRLMQVYNRLESMPSADLTPALRQAFVRDLHQIMGALGKNLEAAQPDFK